MNFKAAIDFTNYAGDVGWYKCGEIKQDWDADRS